MSIITPFRVGIWNVGFQAGFLHMGLFEKGDYHMAIWYLGISWNIMIQHIAKANGHVLKFRGKFGNIQYPLVI
jgi:hypothetical protein